MTFLMDEGNYLSHYGILRKSGRYPWGSGGNPSERALDFFGRVKELRAQGLSDRDIAAGFGMTTTQLRDTNKIARAAKKQADIMAVEKLKQKGMSNVAISEKLGIPESSVRALQAPGIKERNDVIISTAEMLRTQLVRDGGFIDVGRGVPQVLNISKEKLGSAVSVLVDEGYRVHNVQTPQPTNPQQKTTVKVLCPPGTEYRDVTANMSKIRQLTTRSDDGGRTFSNETKLPPLSISSSRLAVRYKEDGGDQADGVIYVRPGKTDLSMGRSRYAQVRIAVDGTHYIKGMAMKKDDLPPGVDLVFNTAKTKAELGTDKLAALKPLKKNPEKPDEIDPDTPFGSITTPITKRLKDGTEVVVSALNIVNEEGNWGDWKNSISSQMLSKQSTVLAKAQLDKAFVDKKRDLDEILSLTNPTIRKKLLDEFAEDTDAAAWRLKAKALPRQRSQVILPVNTMKPSEIYAPNFNHGETVVLIRFPHGGIFEIPELRVNNRHPEAKRLLGDALDAVGINHEVAKRLSGADFDGDTVLVIPNNTGSIKTQPALEKLKGFDPQTEYRGYEGMYTVKETTKNIEMGKISNLITDMTIGRATPQELSQAVRHSMVVIDSAKHGLDYKRSAIDHGIPALRVKYQSNKTGRKVPGAATLISQRKKETDVPDRVPRPHKEGGPIDPKTGKLVFKETGAVSNRTGKLVTKKAKLILETDDVRSIGTGTRMESLYGAHANQMKSLANDARKAMVATPSLKYDPSARKVYAEEHRSLTAKLNLALENSPRERQALILANSAFEAKKRANPDMDRAEEKKTRFVLLEDARNRMGAKRAPVEITDREWEAIQHGAITDHMLGEILNHTKIEDVKVRATPRSTLKMTPTNLSRAKTLAAAGRTQAEIAEILGVSLTTLKTSLKEEG